MTDDYRIDSHKLIYHPDRVTQWLQKGDVYPITVEISPSGTCNHRCIFCAFDYLEYKPVFLDKDLLISNLGKMAEKGIRGIVVCGEGEPLLNKNTPEIINCIKTYHMDVSMASNGVLFTKEVAQECLESLSWVRFSINAGTEKSYQLVHNSRPGDFAKVMANLSNAVEVKHRKRLKATIGVQLLLIPENSADVFLLAGRLKEIGVDYFTVKPFSQHPKSGNKIDEKFNYEDYIALEKDLKKLNTEAFRVIFRSNSMRKLKNKRNYTRCWGLPFWAYIDAKANVWACIAHIGDEKFCYGNLQHNTFTEIWEGKKRRSLAKAVANRDISNCRELCRLDEINTYLHQLKYPNLHMNFI